MTRKLTFALGLAAAFAGCADNTQAPPADLASGGDGPAAAVDLAGAVAVLPGPSRGSPVAISPDDTLAVVVNRDSGSATVLALSYPATGAPTAANVAEISFGAGSEPWQVVISPDNTRAFVVLRHDRKLAVINGLNTATPGLGSTVAVGAEPTGVALTPTGAHAWVTSLVDGTLVEIDTAQLQITRTVDLNAALAATNLLGTNLTARPSLAHPRSLAISNNGDSNDADETIYVTEYFAQHAAAEDAAGSNADIAKQGIVYHVKISDLTVGTISLGALADMGFKDHLNQTAGCYPNQLQSITLNGKYAYVTSVCASPKGPLGPFTKGFAACANPAVDCKAPVGVTAACVASLCNTNCAADADCEPNGGKCNLTTGVCAVNPSDVKTATAPVVSVIDTTANVELSTATASLNAKFRAMYDSKVVPAPDDNTRRFPLLANDLAFVPGGSVGYVSANGADAVFRVRYDATSGAITQVGSATADFINLNPTAAAPPTASGPIGVAITNLSHTGRSFALTANDTSRNLTILDFDAQAVVTTFPTSAMPAAGSPADHALTGKRLFNTGLGRWSLKGQGWGACQSCHTDGLTDNVTWYFARGPRQSVSLDGTFSKKDPTDQRILNWSGIFDELADFENNTRGVSGGVGAIVSTKSAPPQVSDRIDINGLGMAGLNGSAAQAADPANPAGLPLPSLLPDWANITAYVETIRSPRAATNLNSADVASGKALFEGAACQGCHSGDKWTISTRFYAPSATTNGALKSKAWTVPSGFPAALVPAATATNRFMRFGGANPAAFDQIQCILRPVGTFGVAESDVAAGGAFPELRVDMTTAAQGNQLDGNGYNPPSLLGLNVGAPYLHHGGARTLEALFGNAFAQHYQALAPNFLTDAEPARSTKVSQLVQYLLSIDGDAATQTIPAAGSGGGNFCVSP